MTKAGAVILGRDRNEKKPRLYIAAKNPIPYQTPLWRLLLGHDIEFEVIFLDTMGVTPIRDDDFNVTVTWDVPLLEGYKHSFLRNYARDRSIGFFSRVNFGLATKINKENCDAILVVGYDNLSAWLAVVTAKLRGVKVIWRGEATLYSQLDSMLLRRVLKTFVLGIFFKFCDAVLYSCTGNREYLVSQGIDPKKMSLLPCSVDNDYFRAQCERFSPVRDQIRNELGVAPNDFVVLFSGRITDNKRPMDLVAAVETLNRDDLVILFVGDGRERERVQRACEERSVRARFVGFVNQSEISRYYVAGDLYVMISGYDNSPKSMNEAMNFALPVVCTKRAGTAYDLVRDGVNGYLIETGDVRSLSEKIAYFVNNRDKSKLMGQASKEIVEKWSFSACAESIVNALRRVVPAPENTISRQQRSSEVCGAE